MIVLLECTVYVCAQTVKPACMLIDTLVPTNSVQILYDIVLLWDLNYMYINGDVNGPH